MPTILVADDNSNIQKMVTLAVKEMGVTVVGVGNGEAAVRRLPELHPDLVLADIFMPVRSGYEVCEFVKHDSRLSHIPVVLLAGAFDPFDEREAQRVGADGVLKKPFVPPDPLLAMVKSLLDRVPVAVGASGAAATGEQKADSVSLPPPPPPPPPTVEMAPTTPSSNGKGSEAEEASDEEFALMPPALSDEVAEKFGLRRDFSHTAEDEEEESPSSSSSKKSGFRPERTGSHVDPSPAQDDAEDDGSGGRYWESEAPTLARREESGLLRDADLEEQVATDAPSSRSSGVKEDSTPSVIGEQRKPGQESASKQKEMAPAPVSELKTTLESLAPVLDDEPAPAVEKAPTVASSLAPPEAKSPSSRTVPLPATDLAPVVAVSLLPRAVEEKPTSPDARTNAVIEDGSLELGVIPDTRQVIVHDKMEDFIRELKEQEASLAGTEPKRELNSAASPPEPEVAASIPEAASTESAAPVLPASLRVPGDDQNVSATYVRETVQELGPSASPEPSDVNAIVDKVIQKMQPQILDFVSREIMRPVIEALVQRELDKKAKP